MKGFVTCIWITYMFWFLTGTREGALGEGGTGVSVTCIWITHMSWFLTGTREGEGAGGRRKGVVCHLYLDHKHVLVSDRDYTSYIPLVISPSIQPDKLNNGVHPHLPHISLHGEGGVQYLNLVLICTRQHLFKKNSLFKFS